MSTKLNLAIALELLEKTGRSCGVLYRNESGQYCSLGAVLAARTGRLGMDILTLDIDPFEENNETEALATAIDELPERTRWTGRGSAQIVASFNDDWWIDDAEVFQVFRRAIELAS